jgi:hypothetical protein
LPNVVGDDLFPKTRKGSTEQSLPSTVFKKRKQKQVRKNRELEIYETAGLHNAALENLSVEVL